MNSALTENSQVLLTGSARRTLEICQATAHHSRGLKRLISEVDLLLETTTPLPENRTARSRELLRALALTDDILS
jgi:hypothetical protein